VVQVRPRDVDDSVADNRQYESRLRKVPDILSSFNEHMSSCGAPGELLHFLFLSLGQLRDELGEEGGKKQYAANKRAFYALTRKRYILDAVADWSRGNHWEDEEASDMLTIRYFGDRKNDMTRRRQREEANDMGRDAALVDLDFKGLMTGAEKYVWGPACQLCSQLVGETEAGARCDPMEEMKMTEAMSQHLRAHHACRGPHGEEQVRRQMRQEANGRTRRWEERYRDQVLAQCDGKVQPKRNAVRGARHAEYYCAECRKTFTTTAGAMQAHHDAHGRTEWCNPTWAYLRHS